jgi:ketosteroid isomerase-like protein
MSQENVEMVRGTYQAFNENGLAGASEFWDPQIVWHTDPMVPEPGVYTGFDTVRTYLEGFIRAFGAWHIDTQELIDLGGDDVLSVLKVGGRPLGQTDQETRFLDWAWIVSVREGKITRVRSFLDMARAFEAAGLSEQDTHADS